MSPLSNYADLLIFLLIGVGFVIINGLIPLFISPRSTGERAQDPYESGEVPVGSAWIRFDIYYYLFALIFLVFDVEVLFLFPIILIYREAPTLLTFLEVALFLAILSFALLYAWKNEVFSWK